jgi:hypothetical protein
MNNLSTFVDRFYTGLRSRGVSDLACLEEATRLHSDYKELIEIREEEFEDDYEDYFPTDNELQDLEDVPINIEERIAYWRKYYEDVFDVNKAKEIDEKGQYGRTKLHFAACSGDLEKVQELVSAGASCLIKDNSGFLAEDLAALEGYSEIYGFLKANKAEEISRNFGRRVSGCDGSDLQKNGSDIRFALDTQGEKAIMEHDRLETINNGDEKMSDTATKAVKKVSYVITLDAAGNVISKVQKGRGKPKKEWTRDADGNFIAKVS